MEPLEIKKGVYWVGAIDWDLRSFHGHLTQRGSSYNAYLIIDEKITLVDTVKHYLCDEMLKRIEKIVDPARIDYVISNHVEMDHSGSLPMIMDMAKDAVIITSPEAEEGLRKHFLYGCGPGRKNWNFKVVNSGESVNIGKRNLKFILAPMVHWPDSMVSYLAEEKLLLSNDSFGQHIASYQRFEEELGWDIVREEAAKYYANIVLPYGGQVNRLFEAVLKLDIDMIAPSHGLIWRKNLKDIIALYKKWADNSSDNEAVVVYDTMWGSTEKMAYVLADTFEQKNVPCRMKNLKTNHISDIMTSVLSAKYICVGSPTLNNGILPSVSSFLTYMKGLAPKNRVGIAFGSYGWGGQAIGMIENILESCKFHVPVKGLKIQYIPGEQELNELKNRVKEVTL